MIDMLLWLETAWYLWVALGIVVLVVVVVVVVSVVVARMRSRGYERVPHYFRQNS
jgi:heme exporter protein D